MEFCKAFNAATDNMEKGMPIPVVITAYADRIVHSSPRRRRLLSLRMAAEFWRKASSNAMTLGGRGLGDRWPSAVRLPKQKCPI